MREYNNEFRCEDCQWEQSTSVMDRNGDESLEWIPVDITVVPVGYLLREYENLVFELSELEVKLYTLKEYYLVAESEIVNNTDFKAIYGANNQKVRDNHVKTELSDIVSQMKDLEFSIGFLKQYIPLLREVVRCKQ